MLNLEDMLIWLLGEIKINLIKRTDHILYITVIKFIKIYKIIYIFLKNILKITKIYIDKFIFYYFIFKSGFFSKNKIIKENYIFFINNNLVKYYLFHIKLIK